MNIKKYIKILFSKRPIHLSVNLVTVRPEELLRGRCALITGATSGIGYAIADAFIKSGCNVVITGRSEERINDALIKLRNPRTTVLGYVLDNTNVESFDSAFADIINLVGQHGIKNIDILVNNAGVNGKTMPNSTIEDYDKVMNTNLKGTFFLSQMFGCYLVEHEIRGNILNIASASSLRPADSAYILSKWGLRGLTLGLAKSLAPNGITVNGIAPGPTVTPMLHKQKTDSDLSLNRIPLGRYILPEEIANMAVQLVCDMGRSVMGDIVYMTGGAGILTYDDVSYSFKK